MTQQQHAPHLQIIQKASMISINRLAPNSQEKKEGRKAHYSQQEKSIKINKKHK
jgi:hypothetical protein